MTPCEWCNWYTICVKISSVHRSYTKMAPFHWLIYLSITRGREVGPRGDWLMFLSMLRCCWLTRISQAVVIVTLWCMYSQWHFLFLFLFPLYNKIKLESDIRSEFFFNWCKHLMHTILLRESRFTLFVIYTRA